MSEPIVYGDAISTYVRSVRLALEEKGVAHKLVPVAITKGQHKEAEHLQKQPWGKMPAFEHDGNVFYETAAIMRYIDEVFDGPALMPSTPLERVRSNQVLSIIDSYGYPACIANIFIPRVLVPSLGGQTDEAQVAQAKPQAKLFVDELERLLGAADYYGGDRVSLADLHLLPVLTYFAATPEGKEVMEGARKVRAWMERVGSRDSVKAVMPPS